MVNLERHSRHVLLPQVGAEGQRKISESRILCIGAGATGVESASYIKETWPEKKIGIC